VVPDEREDFFGAGSQFSLRKVVVCFSMSWIRQHGNWAVISAGRVWFWQGCTEYKMQKAEAGFTFWSDYGLPLERERRERNYQTRDWRTSHYHSSQQTIMEKPSSRKLKHVKRAQVGGGIGGGETLSEAPVTELSTP
jgi:hypothetical protein